MEHLDRYEGAGVDDAFVDDVTEEERFAARAAAERELARRDAVEGRLTGRRRGLPAALEGEEEDEEEGGRPRRRRRMEEAQADEEEGLAVRGPGGGLLGDGWVGRVGGMKGWGKGQVQVQAGRRMCLAGRQWAAWVQGRAWLKRKGASGTASPGRTTLHLLAECALPLSARHSPGAAQGEVQTNLEEQRGSATPPHPISCIQPRSIPHHTH